MISTKASWPLLLIALLFSLSAFGAPPDEGALGKCSLATLKGTYGGVQQGTLMQQIVPEFPAAPSPSVQTTTVTYDGAGHLSFAFTANRNGIVSSLTGTGTYLLDAHCTYSDEFTLELSSEKSAHSAGYVSGAGMSQRIDIISVDPWIVSSGTLKKMSQGICSVATFKGTFRGITQGARIAGTPPGFPISLPFFGIMAQSITFDGEGNAAGTAILSFGGVVFLATPKGTYTVNDDCTYSDSFAHVGVITGAGDMQELSYIYSNTTDVAIGIIKP